MACEGNRGHGKRKVKLEGICFHRVLRQRGRVLCHQCNHPRALKGNNCSPAVQPFFFPLFICRLIWLKNNHVEKRWIQIFKSLIIRQENLYGVYLLMGEHKGNSLIFGACSCLGNSTEQHYIAQRFKCASVESWRCSYDT